MKKREAIGLILYFALFLMISAMGIGVNLLRLKVCGR
jgi:hypothetical protein